MTILTNCATGLILLCSFLLLSGFHVEGGVLQEDIVTLTRDEELEIDIQLRRLNKPAVKTIKTSYGDLYACVDFYKQPAFDNPLLKNHTFHPRMRPSGQASVSEKIRPGSNARSKHEQVKFTRVECPSGTVPIRRVTREEIVRTKLREKRHALKHGVLASDEVPVVNYAIARLPNIPENKYSSGSAWISVHNITLDDPRQYSLSRMRILGVTDELEVGTQTNPSIYGNEDTHIFVRTKVRNTDHFNLLSIFYIHVDESHPVDMMVSPVSEKGKSSYSVKFALERDSDENWWFYLGDHPRLQMGFWPKAVFDGGLQDLASVVDWGGEAYGPSGRMSPPLGAGECPKRDRLYDGVCTQIKATNILNQETRAANTERYVSNGFYDVVDEGIVSEEEGHVVLFGGPGTHEYFETCDQQKQ